MREQPGSGERFLVGFQVRAGVGGDGSVAEPIVGLEIDSQRGPAMPNEGFRFALQLEAARLLATELRAAADRADRMRPGSGNAGHN